MIHGSKKDTTYHGKWAFTLSSNFSFRITIHPKLDGRSHYFTLLFNATDLVV
jgi:hypothetical protein